MADRYAPKEYRQGVCLDDVGDYVYYSDYATLEAQLAEKEAENEHQERVIAGLNKQLTEQFELSSKLTAESLSRTGAVKVLSRLIERAQQIVSNTYAHWHYDAEEALYALDTHPRDTNTVEDHETGNVRDKPEIGKCGNCGTPDWVKGDMPTCDDSYCTFPYWEATNSEGQQPVAWEAVVDLGRKAIKGSIIASETQKHIRDPLQNYVTLEDAFSALSATRPSEQAVTEAGERAAEQVMTAHYERPLKAWELTALHEALKAAMEAGR